MNEQEYTFNFEGKSITFDKVNNTFSRETVKALVNSNITHFLHTENGQLEVFNSMTEITDTVEDCNLPPCSLGIFRLDCRLDKIEFLGNIDQDGWITFNSREGAWHVM